MNKNDFDQLQPGDIVRHISGDQTWLVTGNYGGRVTAVQTKDLTNPIEWEIVQSRKDMNGIHVEEYKVATIPGYPPLPPVRVDDTFIYDPNDGRIVKVIRDGQVIYG